MRPVVLCALLALSSAGAQSARRPPLGATDVRDIARLLMLEDRRELDGATLARLLAAPHPELRRRAALAIGRIADPRGRVLLHPGRDDADSAVAATVVFATGQLKDTSAVGWLDTLLATAGTPPTVATEAARSLGIIRTPKARAALERYLLRAPAGAATAPTVGEALLAVGRFTTRGDLASIVRWVSSPNGELRWRATWTLFRARDPVAVPHLMRLSEDRSADVRQWAVRGLTAPQADSSTVGSARAAARLHAATRDPDRAVRTEAIRALASHTDSVSWSMLVAGLESRDSWISVSAAEGLARQQARAEATIARLLAATAATRSPAVRVTALQSLLALSPAAAAAPAMEMAKDTASIGRLTAVTVFARLGEPGRSGLERLLADPNPMVRLQANQAHYARADAARDPAGRRSVAREALASPDVVLRASALRSMATWADTTDLPVILDAYERAARDSVSSAATSAAMAAVAGIQRRMGAGASAFFARFERPARTVVRRDADRQFADVARRAWGELRPFDTVRSEADYVRLVERWVVPDYNGAARPRARWDTPRGAIELELYAGDTPIAVDDLVRAVESGSIVGVEFGRVVPNFVDQQRAIRDDREVRDEVNRHRLARANLAWATAGLDTGRPGYTLGITWQPHNEGDFTSMGRIVRGMDAAERIELGDRITGATMLGRGTR